MKPKAVKKASLRLLGYPGSEKVAMATAAAFGRLAGLNEDRLADVQTAVSEACLNAIEHGNQRQADIPVYLTFTAHGHRMQVTVRDRGTGFQMTTVSQPELKQRLEYGGGGLGLFLIQNLADRVRVHTSHRGCVVELHFNIQEGVE